MSDVHRTIRVNRSGSKFRRALSFFGPGYLVAVGYMDPGNWATSLAGGSRFGYALLSVVLLSNLMAVLLQALCTRLAVATGRDLAQACRDAYPRFLAWPLWLLAELAICATDLAEVIGTAIGLNLLFGIPLEIGVILTAVDVLLVLYLQNKGFRRVEALIITLLGVIALCFLTQIIMAQPQWGEVIKGFAPTTEIVSNPDMLYIALGIIGATVMPHNLYLHSGIVQTRDYGHTTAEKREAIRYATLDSTIALTFALVINASILILAAASFHATGHTGVEDLDKAHALESASGFGHRPGTLRHCPALLRPEFDHHRHHGGADRDGRLHRYPVEALDTPRHYALRRHRARRNCDDPLWFAGNDRTSDPLASGAEPSAPFAVIPLVIFTAQKKKMGSLAAAPWVTFLAAITAAIIVVLNLKLIYDFFTGAPI